MQSLLDRELLVITGKGGVGKTTIAAALGLLAARDGRRTIVVEVGRESRLPDLFGLAPAAAGIERPLQDRLSSITIDPDRALLEWLQVLGGRVSGRVLASSGTFQYFAAAAPGARELVTMVKICQLTGGAHERARGRPYDLVVLDAPATGHALGLLGSPHTFGAIARVGPIASGTRKVQELLETPHRSAYLAVALATEMAVTEALELQDGLGAQLGRGLEAVIVNALLPRRFSAEELVRIDAAAELAAGREHARSVGGAGARIADGETRASSGGAPEGLEREAPEGLEREIGEERRRAAVLGAAAAAARAVHERARLQHNQLARLRRREFEVIAVPFVWGANLDVAAVTEIAARLERALARVR
ncbi:MAG TPA: ArsA-related P-loop ATPase [Solirubrobacteraceae bacterium]|nr:ArsA-related P-loop ATPase [Solirubrobacteraceae bacterium]